MFVSFLKSLLLLISNIIPLQLETMLSYFKYTKQKYGEGQRIFLMAPLHHHFEEKGLSESKIIVRFWIVALMSNLIALLTLKLR